MASLKSSSLEEIIKEIERRAPCGVFSCQLDEENYMYYWWGHRLSTLGLTSRIAYEINSEDDETDQRVIGQEDLPGEEDNTPQETYGHYI